MVVALAMLLGGCGYVHFGRRPASTPPTGDTAMAQAFTDLSLEHKILKQELALARKEGEALRRALDGGERATPASEAEIAARLTETTRELATLRVSYARLQAERSAAPNLASVQTGELEAKLAMAITDRDQLRSENEQLRRELTRAREENAGLSGRLSESAKQFTQAQEALGQLNAELLAQKQARAQAEQSTAAVRAQLAAVLAAGGAPAAAPATAGNAGAAASTAPIAGLRMAKAPPADASPTAELRTSAERIAAATKPSSDAAPTPAAVAPARTHVVAAGDTLESIAARYYGSAAEWRLLYDANPSLVTGGVLVAGMQLVVPEKR